MEKIKTLFQKEITRRIEEVIKVDQHDDATVVEEIKEYVATQAIREHFYLIYDSIAQYPSDPHEGIGIWVSGFFGSGKSSFAKLLGYTVANRQVAGKSAAQRFIENVKDEKITSYLENINHRFPIHAIIFDVAMDRGVRTASERITEIMYKALLRDLGYAEDFDLAELEIWLESKGKLEQFISLFNKSYAPWAEERDMPMGRVGASNVLYQMMPEAFSTRDSWLQSLGTGTGVIGKADINPNKLADRAFELIRRRRPGYGLMFVIDEVGQYVSRSVDKMLDLQGIVQAFGVQSKNKFNTKQAVTPCWIVVTSQEKLDEVVDALGDKRVELARLQARFQTTIDLKQSDIEEVTANRVLKKDEKSRKILSDLFDKYEGRLKTYCALERSPRNTKITKDAFIDLYPYLPYQIDLCIDIVAGLRLKRGAQRHIGGSNRTIIKQAQQMLIHPQTNLAEREIGALVTLDMVYELLYAGNLLPSEVTREVDDVPKHIPNNHTALKVAKVITLLEAVTNLPRTAHNIAVTLYPSVQSDSILDDVKKAIEELEKCQVIRDSEEGYKLLTFQEKNWDTERNTLEPKPKNRNLIKSQIIDDIFSGPKTRTYRYKELTSFKIGLWVDNEKKQDGSIQLIVQTAEDASELKDQKEKVQAISREEPNRNKVYWLFQLTEEIHDLIREEYRSTEMINSYSRQTSDGGIAPENRTCLEEEKRRENRISQRLRTKMTGALESGIGFFRGIEKDGSSLGNSISEIVTAMLDIAVPDIYPKLEMGAKKIKGDEPDKVLSAANLNGLPAIFYNTGDGLNLVIRQGNRYVPNANAEIALEILNYIKSEHSYGNKVTGKSMEAHFQLDPYGWGGDILRLVLAVLLRGGAIEINYQGRRFRGHTDPDSKIPLTGSVAFRSAAFSPKEAVNLKTLSDAAKNYEEITGEEIELEEEAISTAFKELATEDGNKLIPIHAQVNSLDLPLKEFIQEFIMTTKGILDSDADDCVKTFAGEGITYKENREKTGRIAEALSEYHINTIKHAKMVLSSTLPILQKLGTEEEIAEKATELKAIFASEDFYDRLEAVRIDSESIFDAYSILYESKHRNRKEAYKKGMELVKGHSSFSLLSSEDQKEVLNPFTTRYCENAILTDTNTCDSCRATIEQLESDALAIRSIQETAIRKIEELTAPDEKIQYVRVSELVSGYMEKKEDVEKALEEIREHIMKMLAEGYKVYLQ